jgi:hypothetical protein
MCFRNKKSLKIIRIRKSKDRQHTGQKTEEQTTQGPKETGQKEKQRSTKHTYKTKDRVTRTPLKQGVNSDDPEGYTVPTPLVTPVVLI